MQTIETQLLGKNIQTWINEHNKDKKQLLSVLQKIHAQYHEISEEAMSIVAKEFQIQPAEVHSLSSLFTGFSNNKSSKFIFQICDGLACDKPSKENIRNYLQNKLKLDFGEVSSDGLFTLSSTQCMGFCDIGPVLKVNDRIYCRVSKEMIDQLIDQCKESPDYSKEPSESCFRNFWDGNSEIESLPVLTPGCVIKTLPAQSPNDLLLELINEGLINKNVLDSLENKKSFSPTKRMIVCNTDLPQSGSFIERVLLSDHYDLFIEGFIASAYAMDSLNCLIFLRPDFLSIKPVLESYWQKLNDVEFMQSPNRKLDLSNYLIDFRTSPGFVAGGTQNILQKAVNSSCLQFTNSQDQSDITTTLDVETIIRIGSYLLQKTKPVLRESQTTRIFAVTGDCAYSGVYELPLEMTISELLTKVGAQETTAVQIGGAFGQFIVPTNFNSHQLSEYSGLISSVHIFGSKTDFREVALKLLNFNLIESCGQCSPCRDGSAKLLESFSKIKNSRRNSINELNETVTCMQLASKCEFGQKASKSFQSLIQCFPELL